MRFFRRIGERQLPLKVVQVELNGSDGSQYRFNLRWDSKQLVAEFTGEGAPPNVWLSPLDTLHLTWEDNG